MAEEQAGTLEFTEGQAKKAKAGMSRGLPLDTGISRN